MSEKRRSIDIFLLDEWKKTYKRPYISYPILAISTISMIPMIAFFGAIMLLIFAVERMPRINIENVFDRIGKFLMQEKEDKPKCNISCAPNVNEDSHTLPQKNQEE